MIKLDKVEISTQDGGDGTGHLVVDTFFTGTDRPRAHGFGLLLREMKLAQRLKAAIEAGKVYTNLHIKTDINGKTYVGYDCTVTGRYMNADLKRMGF